MINVRKIQNNYNKFRDHAPIFVNTISLTLIIILSAYLVSSFAAVFMSFRSGEELWHFIKRDYYNFINDYSEFKGSDEEWIDKVHKNTEIFRRELLTIKYYHDENTDFFLKFWVNYDITSRWVFYTIFQFLCGILFMYINFTIFWISYFIKFILFPILATGFDLFVTDKLPIEPITFTTEQISDCITYYYHKPKHLLPDLLKLAGSSWLSLKLWWELSAVPYIILSFYSYVDFIFGICCYLFHSSCWWIFVATNSTIFWASCLFKFIKFMFCLFFSLDLDVFDTSWPHTERITFTYEQLNDWISYHFYKSEYLFRNWFVETYVRIFYPFYFDDDLPEPIINEVVNKVDVLNTYNIRNTDIFKQPIFFYFGILFAFSVFFSFLFCSYLGVLGVFTLNLVSLVLFWLSLIPYAHYFVICNGEYSLYLGKWIFLNFNFKPDFYFLIDTLAYSFIFLTTTIALFVYVYAFSYFRYEPLMERFLILLCFFVISMLFLVSSGNLIMLFLGWELIGMSSFFLINFWVSRKGTLKSSFKAYSFNKLSDFFVLLFLITIFLTFYDFDIKNINNQMYLYTNSKFFFIGFDVSIVEFSCFLLTGAAVVKSAQFGTHIWLPDSMEAPVPASALIHSATLVSAGIFLILRFSSIFDLSNYASIYLTFIGSITCAFGGVGAAYQSDIKRILAFSTISHCGFLMILCGLRLNEFVIVYLYIHGFFKATAFMCVGNVIRFSKNYQDFRKMGGLYNFLPLECFIIFCCLFNLSGLPITLGFFIKHFLFISLNGNIFLYTFVISNIIIGALSGIFYSSRLFYYVFFDFKKSSKTIYEYSTRLNLNSKYCSNTSFSSNFSIIGLFLVSNVITAFLINSLVNSNFNFSDCLNLRINSQIWNTQLTSNNLLFNLSYLSWVVIIVILLFVFVTYRRSIFNYLTIRNVFWYIYFFSFLFCFYTIL